MVYISNIFHMLNSNFLSPSINTLLNVSSTNYPQIVNNYNCVDDSANQIFGMNYKLASIIIPVVITVSVFLIGQLISWLVSKFERLTELNSIKKTITHWIFLTEPAVKSQIQGCDNFANSLHNLDIIQSAGFQYNPLLVDKLQQIELRDLIETIMLNLDESIDKKTKIIFNIISQVEFLTKMEIDLKENYKKFQTSTFLLMEDWNQTLRKFNIEMNNASKAIYEIQPSSVFVINKNKLCNKFWQYKESQPLTKIFNELILPMENEVQQYLASEDAKHLALNLAYSIEDLKIIKLKWEVHKEGHRKLALEFSDKINTVYNVLKDTATQLEQADFNCFFKIK